MELEWKNFKIDLKSFGEFLQSNVPPSDGIVAGEHGMVLVEKVPFSQNYIDVINSYYNSLTEEEEQNKLSRPSRLQTALESIKQDLLSKDLTALTLIERKILLNMPLTSQEQDSLLG